MKKIVGHKATGSLVLIEMLSANEVMSSMTGLILSENTKLEAPQAYILDIGPALEKEKWGFDVGDRVIFSGGFVPVPRTGSSGRQAGVIDAFSIKAVLEEQGLEI